VQRLATAAVLSVLAVAAVLYLPSVWFFILVALVIGWASAEYVRIAKVWAPGAPLEVLVGLVPLAAVILAGLLPVNRGTPDVELELFAAALLGSVGVGTLVLLTRTPLPEAFAAFGAFAFGVPYFALPSASLYRLHRMDPWLVILLLAIVALGDTAALYAGTRLGRRKLAPTVSPNKTWEGSAASFATAVGVTSGWSLWRLGELSPSLLAIGALAALAAQVGDLVESMIKRGAGIKDSGNLLPGHGGMLDRVDALVFAAPVFLFALWLLGI
jgi:phosphatidate cytidylyltransferase